MNQITQILSEQLDLSESKIDSQNRVLNDVVLIRSGTSRNLRHYPENVLQTAAPIFEGVKAYANHNDPKDLSARSMRDVTGWYANVRYQEGKLIADRYFTRNQAGQDAWAIAEDIVSGRAPKNLVGLSINAAGKGTSVKRPEGNVFEVQVIERAVSVDDVSEAAAGGSYTEGAQPANLTTMLLEALTFEEWFNARPEFTKRVQNEMKTVRQDDALKAALADAEAARQALTEAQAALEQAQQEREAAVSEAATARRERDVDRLVLSANVPKDWLPNLREQLMNADSEQWPAIIEQEQLKAKAAGHKVVVTGASQQVHVPTVIKESTTPKTLDMSRFASPEDFAAYMRGLTQ